MKIWKKALVVLVLAATVMGVASMQYAKLGVSMQYTVSTKYSLIQLMAGDGAVVGTGYVLTNSSSTYVVQLGTFAKGFNKTYSAAFAIVNSESNVKLRITKVYCTDTRTIIALHENMSVNAFSETGTGAYIVYYDKGNTYDYTSDGYVLRNGQGDYSAGSLQYTANDGGAWTSATFDSSNVWITGALKNADVSTDPTSKSNFVWVQITIDLTGATDGTTVNDTIYIEVAAL